MTNCEGGKCVNCGAPLATKEADYPPLMMMHALSGRSQPLSNPPLHVPYHPLSYQTHHVSHLNPSAQSSLEEDA